MTNTKTSLISHSILQESDGRAAWDTFHFPQIGSKKHAKKIGRLQYYHQLGPRTKRQDIFNQNGSVQNTPAVVMEATTLAHKRSLVRFTVQKCAFEAASRAADTVGPYRGEGHHLIKLFDYLSLPNSQGLILPDSTRSLQPVESLLTKTCYPGDFFKSSTGL